MTEAEWLDSDDPAAMLNWLSHNYLWRSARTDSVGFSAGLPPSSWRKMRLFSCGCCRLAWNRLASDASRSAVEVAERFADGQATEGDRAAAMAALPRPNEEEFGLDSQIVLNTVFPDGWYQWEVLIELMGNSGTLPRSAQSAVVRDIFNPFAQTVWTDRTEGKPSYREIDNGDLRRLVVFRRPWLSWNDGVIPRLVAAAYEARDFSGLPVLADALEDAGCDDVDILNHCRGLERCPKCAGAGSINFGLADGACDNCPPLIHEVAGGYCRGSGWVPKRGPCVRGCWVVDTLLRSE